MTAGRGLALAQIASLLRQAARDLVPMARGDRDVEDLVGALEEGASLLEARA
jgi:hypothetical protein